LNVLAAVPRTNNHAPFIERGFTIDARELSYVIEEVKGEPPDFIHGSYYLNGPARFARTGMRYRHWLDGDGMVCALRFEGRRVHFLNRFVRSHKFVAEEKAGQPIFRTFGTAFDGDQLKRGMALESPVNVSVYRYSRTLLALGEQGLPWELDPMTLETRGKFTFGGCLNDVSPFAAHPKFDPATGEMFNFGISFSATQPTLNIYRFDGQAKLLYRKRHAVDFPCSVHDFSLSPCYSVFYLSPYILEMEMLAREGRTLMEALSWEPERGSRLLIASRQSGDEVASIPVGQRYCLHLINCFEMDGQLMVDVVEYDRPLYDQYQVVPELFTDVGEGQPVRFVVDMKSWEVIARRQIDYRSAPDFPSIDPRQVARPYHDFWMLGISATGQYGRKFFDQLVHADWGEATTRDIYQAPAMQYLGGEPIFIGDPNDRRTGAIICQVFDAEHTTSGFAIFDAFDIARGPVSVLRLKEPIPPLFHASFHRE
jgi:all-trans-8'-apo-beta-carotenal 15,15'-oxygenase